MASEYNVEVQDHEGNVYHPTPDILSTKEELMANNDAGKTPDALLVKQLSSDLSFPDAVGFYPDIQDGVRGYNTDRARGADTFVPFRSGAEYVTTTLNTGRSSGSFTFPDDYRECYLVLSAFRLGTGTTISDPSLSNDAAAYEELYDDVCKNSQNSDGTVGQRTVVYKFTDVKKGDIFSYSYTERSAAHVSLFA